MAYARLGDDSDIYLYMSITGNYDLTVTRGAGKDNFFQSTTSPQLIINNLKFFRSEGFKVPERVITRLNKDIK